MIEGPFRVVPEEQPHHGWRIELTLLPTREGRRTGNLVVGLNIQPNGSPQLRELTHEDIKTIAEALKIPETATSIEEPDSGPRGPRGGKLPKRKFTDDEKVRAMKAWVRASKTQGHAGSNKTVAELFDCGPMQINGLILMSSRNGYLEPAERGAEGAKRFTKKGLQFVEAGRKRAVNAKKKR